MKIDFFGGWTEGFKQGNSLKNKIILTGRVIKHSFQALWRYKIRNIWGWK